MSTEDEQIQGTLYLQRMGQYYKLGNKHGTMPQLCTRNQFAVRLLSLMPLDEMVHVEKSLR